jgi:hypothetical protein
MERGEAEGARGANVEGEWGAGTRAEAREVIITHNCLKLAALVISVWSVLSPGRTFFIFFRDFPGFSGIFRSQGHFTEGS